MGRRSSELPSGLAARSEIVDRVRAKQLAMFLDYDGTLTPIVSQPENALLSDEMRAVLRELAGLCTVTVVSGRDRGDVEPLVGLPQLIYAGSHGFDIAGPDGLRMEFEGGIDCLPELEIAEKELEPLIRRVPGGRVERKRFAIAVHYRNIADEDVARVEAAVRDVLGRRDGLRLSGGKKVFELRPDIDWDKGRAVLWLIEVLGLDHADVVPMYIGDDVTDEDAFRALAGRGISIVVGEPAYDTDADYLLRDTAEVGELLSDLIGLLRADR